MFSIVHSEYEDPYYNIALEEYLFKTSGPGDEILYLWQNQKTVVIGRNQNPWKECNLQELGEMGGHLVRRLSGGGAVYHDLGNLNFTFISDYKPKKMEENIELIVRVLRDYGIDAHFSGKNDILANGFKVSGTAYFEENNRLCHHGTLLVDTELEKLASLLTVSKLKLESKGIDSVRSRVKNLKEINGDITVENLKNGISSEFVKKFESLGELENKIDRNKVLRRREEFMDGEWNYGSTPEFDVCISKRMDESEVELCLKVIDGMIVDVKVNTDSLDLNLPEKIYKELIHTKY